MRCLKCNSEVRAGVKFCTVCGADQRVVEHPPLLPPQEIVSEPHEPTRTSPTLDPKQEVMDDHSWSAPLSPQSLGRTIGLTTGSVFTSPRPIWPWVLGAMAGLGVLLAIILGIGKSNKTTLTPTNPTPAPIAGPTAATPVPGMILGTTTLTKPESTPEVVPAYTGDSSEPADLSLEDISREAAIPATELNKQGLKYCAQGKPEDAVLAFKRAAKAQPQNPEYLNNIGYAYQLLAKYASSNHFCLKSLELSPGRTVAFGNIAYNYAKLDQSERAVEYWVKYVNSMPNTQKRERGIEFLRKLKEKDGDPRIKASAQKVLEQLRTF